MRTRGRGTGWIFSPSFVLCLTDRQRDGELVNLQRATLHEKITAWRGDDSARGEGDGVRCKKDLAAFLTACAGPASDREVIHHIQVSRTQAKAERRRPLDPVFALRAEGALHMIGLLQPVVDRVQSKTELVAENGATVTADREVPTRTKTKLDVVEAKRVLDRLLARRYRSPADNRGVVRRVCPGVGEHRLINQIRGKRSSSYEACDSQTGVETMRRARIARDVLDDIVGNLGVRQTVDCAEPAQTPSFRSYRPRVFAVHAPDVGSILVQVGALFLNGLLGNRIPAP